MRRALVIAGVMLAGLLALAPALATAGSPRSDKELPLPEEVETFLERQEYVFSLGVEGFTVDVDVAAEEEEGDQAVTLSIARDGLASTYVVPATITDDSVTAKFGALGELNFHFGPKKGVRKCLGKLTFAGSFTFAGENGYVHVDADEAEGAKVGGEFEPCEELEGGLVPDDESVSLEAVAGSLKRGAGRRVTVEQWRAEGRTTLEITASRIEETEGMRITRGATLGIGPGAFHHDVNAGTATLKPPAPFTGWARMTPGRGGKGVWEGTLRLPTLGGAPIELTGPAFRAHFVEIRTPRGRLPGHDKSEITEEKSR